MLSTPVSCAWYVELTDYMRTTYESWIVVALLGTDLVMEWLPRKEHYAYKATILR